MGSICCTDPKTNIFINSERIQAEFVFVFTAKSDGSNLSLLNDTPRVRTELSNEPLFQLETRAADDKVLILGLTREQTQNLEPLTDMRDSSLIQLKKSSSESNMQSNVSINSLPPDVFFQEIDQELSSLTPGDNATRQLILSQYKIHLPVDLDRCRNETREKLELFYNPPSDCRRPYVNVLRYDEDKFIALSDNHAQLFDRREEPSCGEVDKDNLSAKQRIIKIKKNEGNSAVGSRVAADGSKLFVSVLSINDGEDTQTSQIIERRLYPDGFGPVTSSQSFSKANAGLLGFDGKIDQVTIDQEDQVFILYETGLVATRRQNEELYKLSQISPLTKNSEDRGQKYLQTLENGQHRHLVTRTGVLHYGDIDEDSWQSIPLEELSSEIRPWDGSSDGNGTIYFAGNDNGQGWLFSHHYENQALSEIPIRFPSRIDSCFVNGRLRQIRRVVNTSAAIYALTSCNMVVRIRKTDRCQSFFRLADNDAPEFSQNELRGLIILQEEVYTFDREGRIHRINVTDFDQELELRNGN